MIYYQVTLYTKREDDFSNLPLKGSVKVIKWLKYSVEDGGLEIGQQKEDESLAMKILINNLQQVEEQLLATNDPEQTDKIGSTTQYIKNEDDLKSVIDGKYQKAVVEKYESNFIKR